MFEEVSLVVEHEIATKGKFLSLYSLVNYVNCTGIDNGIDNVIANETKVFIHRGNVWEVGLIYQAKRWHRKKSSEE